MTFWSGEKLLRELPNLVDPPREGNIDCAAYRLTIGREIYISPTDQTPNAKERTVRQLEEAEAFAIPAGQFAFLMTEETVTVPASALAFISMRAGTKFRGLINVSGFHVDPGYRGKLLFAVFNAGPVSVHLKRGDACFLIWYADLDAASERIKLGTQLTEFPVERINAISGELHSFEGLARKLKDTEKSLGDRVHALERESAIYKIVATLLLGLAVTYVGALIKDYVSKHEAPTSVPSAQTSTSTATTAPSPPSPVQPGSPGGDAATGGSPARP